jgi:hypothetical protein
MNAEGTQIFFSPQMNADATQMAFSIVRVLPVTYAVGTKSA